MGMTLKELLTKGEGTISAKEAKALAAQCRMDEETLYTLLEERGIKVQEEDAEPTLDVDSIMAEVENAENNNDDMGISEDEEEQSEENPADLKAAMDELLDDPVKNYLKQIGQIPLLSAEQEAGRSTSKRTAPASRLKRMRTAAAIPKIWTRRATRSPARMPRKRLPKRKLWRLWRTAP